jgi:hypothetical protein
VNRSDSLNPNPRRLTLLSAAALAMAAALFSVQLAFGAGEAQATLGPVWRLNSFATATSAAPGDIDTIYVDIENEGDAHPDNSPLSLKVDLAPGLKLVDAHNFILGSAMQFDCSELLAGTSDICPGSLLTNSPSYGSPFQVPGAYVLDVEIEPGASGVLTSALEISGGGADPARGASRITVAEAPSFGLDAFDSQVTDEAGSASTQAGGHPYQTSTEIHFNTVRNPHHNELGSSFPPLWQQELDGPAPVEPPKDIVVDLPRGLIGNPNAEGIAQCSAADLANSVDQEARPLCPVESQVGTAAVWALALNGPGVGHAGLYNMTPPAGVPARFGFQYLGTTVYLDAHLRPDDGISIVAHNTPEALALAGSTVNFWGVPAAPSHDHERPCPGHTFGGFVVNSEITGVAFCPTSAPQTALLRNPTSCTPAGQGLEWSAEMDSWLHPGLLDGDGRPVTSDPAWAVSSFQSHAAPGYPLPPDQWGGPVGIDGCDEVPFTPHITVQPTTHVADSPTGLDVDLSMPQEALEEPGAIAQADVKDSIVTQPVGTRINPATAEGLSGCSEDQIGLLGTGFGGSAPIRFNSAQPACPDSSKIGTVEIESPLVPDTLTGGIYQAKQDENPFGSTLAFYTSASADGVTIKLPAEVKSDPQTGQVTTVFRDNPQLPFTHYKLHFFGGPKAPLITPPTCGTFTTHTSFTGWANPDEPVHPEDSFQITEGAGGSPCPNGDGGRPFAPSFEAGTVNPLAGAFSSFVLKVGREDGMQELSGIETTLPPGLLGKLAGIPYCPEAAIAAAKSARGTAEQGAPSCPAASLLGVTDATAGAGPTPFHNPGRAYLAGPYKGAPLSVVIVTPAVAGPLDLGTVVVRAALQVDPTTTQIHVVSDPLPSMLEEGGDGFPLDVRQVVVQMNRPGFTLNPTSCDPMSVDGKISAVQGASANVSSRFQVGGCDKLGFKPKLHLALKGAVRRAKFPQLDATLKMPAAGANIARAAVTLPRSVQIENAHIVTPCTRVQFAAEACPPHSVLGRARAFSPLLDKPLEGPVYFRSNGGEHLLPDIVADLRGQIHVVLVGHVDTVHHNGVSRIRNTFETVPDAPVSKFRLTLFGGKRSLLVNNRNLCRQKNLASMRFDAQNGKVAADAIAVGDSCKHKQGRKKNGKRGA